MFSSFWGGLTTVAIFVAAFNSWRNGRALNKIKENLDAVQFRLNRISDQTPYQPDEKSSLTPAKPSEAATENPAQTVQQKPQGKKSKYNLAQLAAAAKAGTNAATKAVAASENVEKRQSEKSPETPKPSINEIAKTQDNKDIAWAFRNTKNLEAETNSKPKQPTPQPTVKVEDIWKKYSNFEFDLGAKLPVWLGSVALIIAGFFFVKYSVENNLVPPYMRLIILYIVGAVMIMAAEQIRKRPKFANGRRISQALTGVGFAIIYGVLYAGSQIWHYIPEPLAIGGMVLTTLATLYMSIRYGIGVAYLALITAYLTPFLMKVGESSTLFLFAYILGIFTAMAYVARLQKWWNMLLVLLIGNFAWVGYWYSFAADPAQAIWVNIFLVAQSAVIVWSLKPLMDLTKNAKPSEAQKPTKLAVTSPINLQQSQQTLGKVVNIIAHIGGLIFLSQIMQFAEFSLADWMIFNVVIVASIGMAKYDEDNFIYMPFAAATLGAFMFAAWQANTLLGLSAQMLLAVILLSGFGVYQAFNSQKGRIWAFLATLTPLIYFIIYYLHVGTNWSVFFVYEIQLPKAASALVAVAFSAIFAGLYVKMRNQLNIIERNNILSNFAASSTAFLSLAIAIYTDRSVWPIAFAVQMTALSYIDAQLKNKIIRVLTIILAALVLGLLLPNLLDILNYMIVLTTHDTGFIHRAWDIEFLNSPLLYMGIPTVAFAASAYFMRQHLDNITVKIMETIGLTLFTLTGYLVIRYLFNGDQHSHNFDQTVFETGVITSFIFIMGLISFWLAKYTGRAGYITRGWVNIGMAFARIVVFDILLHNPLFDLIALRGVIIFNPLIFIYALPIVWLFAVEYLVPKGMFDQAIKYLKIFSTLLLFGFINLNIRFAFQDYLVYWQATSVAELYSYSIIWLIFGIILLFLAIWKQQKILRYASQFVVMLTVTKVFLYDAANLEGLYRIASFAILGICLIGISSIYSKYILIEDKADEQPNGAENKTSD